MKNRGKSVDLITFQAFVLENRQNCPNILLQLDDVYYYHGTRMIITL